MLIIVPISHVDSHMVESFAANLQQFGPFRGHSFSILPTQDVPPQLSEEFKAKMAPLFDATEIFPVKTTSKSWPMGCNQHFRAAANYAATKGMVWYFLELDNAFTRSPFNELEQEYHEAKKPFMGAIVPTRTTDGSNVGSHMVGTGIYAAGFARASVKLSSIDRVFVWAAKTPMEPFDIACRHETTPFCHPTAKIQHNFKTCNYRLEDGQIVCDNLPGNAQSHAKPVDPRACVVHGCKDGTLAALILSGVEIPKTIPVKSASSGAVPSGGSDGDPSSSPPAEVHGSGQSLEPPKPEPLPPGPESPADGKPKVTSPSFIAYKIQALLKDGQGRRPKDCAEELKLTEDQIKAVIAEETSGLELRNRQWVVVKPPTLPTE